MTLSGKRIARGNAAFSVFERICITPGSTRAKVASEVGLSIASVGNAVDRLIDEGLVSAYQGKSLGGRPAEILFPSRRSVFITDVRGENARAFCLDQTCGVLFFDERSFCSCADTADALRDLIGRFAESPEFSRDELFAVSFLSEGSPSVEPDVIQYAEKRLSPLFVKAFNSDLLSAEVTASGARFDNAIFCSVCRDDVAVSSCKTRNGQIVFGEFSKLISSYGSGFGRVFAACRDEKEAGEELSSALLNSVLIMSPDTVLIEIKGSGFDEKFGNYVKKSLSEKTPRAPEIKTFFRDEKALRSRVLSLLRRFPFEKEGINS